MSRSFIVGTALLSLRAAAQTATSWTDAKTGIKFNGIQLDNGFTLGYALPENPTTDFIAQLSAPIGNGGGWAGFPLAQSMVGPLSIVAWPNDGKVISSFRVSTGYSSPGVATGSFSMVPIPDGTFVNDTAFSYTFLCKNCISNEEATGLVISPDQNVMGYASSDTPLTDPTSASAALNYHSAGFGAFGLTIADAKSAEFATWAALAGEGGAGSRNPTALSSNPPAPSSNPPAPSSNPTEPPTSSTEAPTSSTETPPSSTETPPSSTETPPSSTETPPSSTETPPSSTKSPYSDGGNSTTPIGGSTGVPIVCPGAPAPSSPPASTPAPAPAPAQPGSGFAKPYGKCGGKDHTGPTQCESGFSCKIQNDWYSQCVASSQARAIHAAPVHKRRTRLGRRSGGMPMFPANEEVVVRRNKAAKASFLDAYAA